MLVFVERDLTVMVAVEAVVVKQMFSI